MIRVRYRDFRSGRYGGACLHGSAERQAREVTVYLLPGLAGWQRRAVIRRLRQEASRGFGPELPLLGLAVALAVDRVRMAARLAAAVVRMHPAVTLLPCAVVVAGMTLFVLGSGDGGAPGSVAPRSRTVPGAGPGPWSQAAGYAAAGVTVWRPRVERVCHGMLPGVAPSAGQLACSRVMSYPAQRPEPRDLAR